MFEFNNKVGLSEETLVWIIKSIDTNGEVCSIKRLKGSTSSILHHITLQTGQVVKEVVVRQFDNQEWLKEEPDLALHEADCLRIASNAEVTTPEIIAYDEHGTGCGVPKVLMTMLEGSVELKPNNRYVWVKGLAESLIKIHATEVADLPWTYFTYNNVSELKVPTWSSVPEAWRKVIGIVQGPQPKVKECFIHRDYHPANVLWKNGVVSGVVDWVNACRGPAGIDIGHCRLNLALLYDVETADKFLAAYKDQVEESYMYDPYWDMLSLIDVLFGPPEVYPGWAAFGVTGLTNRMMEERMDAYAVSLLSK